MASRLLSLYPAPAGEVVLKGAYLAHRLHAPGRPGVPFIYGSFVASLDGRIAVTDPESGASRMPPEVGSAADFRLFQELQAQADCLVTHAGYLRDLAAGRLDDVLQVGLREGTADLAAWRAANGLAPQPAILVASSSLDFPLPASPAAHAQRVIVATGAAAPAARVARLRAAGVPVIIAGTGAAVEGAPLRRVLGEFGFRSAYLLAGPRMLDAVLRDGVLSRLYVTVTHRLLGGEMFQTMVSGPALGPAGRLRLAGVLYDADAPDGCGQWFARFDPLPVP